MLTPDEFAAAIRNLGAAFSKPLNGPLVLQYYNVFKVLSSRDLKALVTWAIETLDAPFPTIARLRKHAVEEGYLSMPARRPDLDAEPVIFNCPECGGSYSIRKDRLLADASSGLAYRCQNPEHWDHPVVVSAASVVQELGIS
jgi:predicted RNA-binding Zn-ribbon protein involved in translation (DUF1610 family)